MPRKQGQGRGGRRQYDLGARTCICPSCGAEFPHERGYPCRKLLCPYCDVPLDGKV